MKATVVNKRGITIVSFEGHLNFSHPQPIKDQLKKLYASKQNQKVIFNFEKLEFLGSSGIRPFIEALNELHRIKTHPRFFGVPPEFQRLFQFYQGKKAFKIFGTEKEAIKSYGLSRRSSRA